jgi:O-antigen/teichoic acid export membrane protein
MKTSRVTWKFRKKIGMVMTLTFVVIIVGVIRQSIDGLVLAAKQNLGKVGIFGLASYIASVMQAPFRSMTAVTLPILSRAWKDKNHAEINRIYQRSSINLLSFALFMFLLIWMNFRDAIGLLNINPEYLEGEWVFFMLGMVTIIELGTGVNGQIIGTSTYWRFELWTSLLLTAMIIPLSYTLTVRYGLIGPAVANLVSFTIYNSIRFGFLWKRFQMQPFSMKTLEILLIAGLSYLAAWLVSQPLSGGLTAMLVRSTLFSVLFITGMIKRNISPDAEPVFLNVLSRLKLKK